MPGGTFLVNSPFGRDEVWDRLPRVVQEQLVAKKAKLFVIDAYSSGAGYGDGQPDEHDPAGVLLRDLEGTAARRGRGGDPKSIRDTYGRKGEEIVQKNMKPVDETLAHLFEVTVPEKITSTLEMPPPFSTQAPAFERNVLGVIYEGRGTNCR